MPYDEKHTPSTERNIMNEQTSDRPLSTEIAYAFLTSAAAVLGIGAGMVVIGWAMEKNEARIAKKNPTTEES